jgi:hypothetical protein
LLSVFRQPAQQLFIGEFTHGVDLSSVTGGQQCHFRRTQLRQARLQRFNHSLWGEGNPAPQIDRGNLVINTQYQDIHSHQFLSTLLRFTDFRSISTIAQLNYRVTGPFEKRILHYRGQQ